MVAVVGPSEYRIRKARLISWIFMAVASISLFFNLLFVLTMYQMGGRLTIMTQLFNTRTRGTETFVLTDILNQETGNVSKLEKALVYRFIEEWNFRIPDQQELLRRWGPTGTLALISSPKVFKPVRSKNAEKIKKALEELPTHADNIEIISRVGRHWSVSFDLWTHAPDVSVATKKQANLVLDYSPDYVQQIANPDYYYNPLGMVVVDYTVTDVK